MYYMCVSHTRTYIYIYTHVFEARLDMYEYIHIFINSLSYHIISYHIISYHIISYHIISCRIISFHTISYHTISCHIISYHIMSNHVISYHIISYHIISYHIISYHIISYHIISYHFISYHIIADHSRSYIYIYIIVVFVYTYTWVPIYPYNLRVDFTQVLFFVPRGRKGRGVGYCNAVKMFNLASNPYSRSRQVSCGSLICNILFRPFGGGYSLHLKMVDSNCKPFSCCAQLEFKPADTFPESFAPSITVVLGVGRARVACNWAKSGWS